MVLNCFNNISELISFQGLLCHDSMEVVNGDEEMTEISSVLLERCGMAESSLVVGNGPLRSAHDTKVVIKVRIQGAEEGVLGGEATGGNLCECLLVSLCDLQQHFSFLLIII